MCTFWMFRTNKTFIKSLSIWISIFYLISVVGAQQQPNNGNLMFQLPPGTQNGATFPQNGVTFPQNGATFQQNGATFQTQGSTFQGVQGSVQPGGMSTQFQTIPMDNQFQTVSNSGNQFQNTQFQMTGGQQTLQTGAATAAQPSMQPMDGNGLQTVNSFASPNGQESNVAIQNTVDTAQSITGNANQDGQNSSSNNGNGEVDPNFNGNIVSIGGRIYIVEENGSMTEAPNFAHLVGSTIRNGRINTNFLNVQQSGLRSSGNQPNQLGVPTLPPLTVGANGQVLPGPQPIPGNPPMNGQFPINNQIPTNGQPAFNGQVPVNGQFPVNNQIPANQPFLMNNQIPFNGQIQGNGRFPVNGPVPFPPRPPMNGPFSPNSLFPIGRRAPVQPPFRGNALPNGPVPFLPNRRFPVPNGGFPNFPRPFPGPPGMIPPLPPGGQFRGPPRPFGPPPNRAPGMPPRQPFFDPRFG